MPRFDDVVICIQHIGERDTKYFIHFARLGLYAKLLDDKAHNGRHRKAGHRFMRGESTKDFDTCRGQADLFMGFAQRRFYQICIRLVLLATGKGDLPRMVFKCGGPFGQDQVIPLRSSNNRSQNSSRTQLAAGRQVYVLVQVKIGRRSASVLQRCSGQGQQVIHLLRFPPQNQQILDPNRNVRRRTDNPPLRALHPLSSLRYLARNRSRGFDAPDLRNMCTQTEPAACQKRAVFPHGTGEAASHLGPIAGRSIPALRLYPAGC
mmetsp:Transcript_18032/g.27534  ORF Transcript_18032/g.27534 Transcript_18032/m.27534 type:complete len:263 (+) Transcript_18032:451-1239(+)